MIGSYKSSICLLARKFELVGLVSNILRADVSAGSLDGMRNNLVIVPVIGLVVGFQSGRKVG